MIGASSRRGPGQRAIDALPLAVAIALLAGALFVVWEAQGFRLGARLFPVYVGTATALLAVLEVIAQIMARLRPPAAPREEEPATADFVADETERTPAFYARGLLYFGWILGLYALTALLGFFYAVPLWVLALLRLQFRAAWLPSFGLALGLVAMIYALQVLLMLRWPRGLIPLPL